MSKDSVRIDEWARDVAPSTELRRWYGHDPERFEEFARRYRSELRRAPAAGAAKALVEAASSYRLLVLLTATRDVELSGAAVLAAHLRKRR